LLAGRTCATGSHFSPAASASPLVLAKADPESKELDSRFRGNERTRMQCLKNS
jgi:hypothetical protein